MVAIFERDDDKSIDFYVIGTFRVKDKVKNVKREQQWDGENLNKNILNH